jgi:hypothetical protein
MLINQEGGHPMGVNLREKLSPDKLKELEIVSSMIARGESLAAIQNAWKNFLTDSGLQFEPQGTAEREAEMRELVDSVIHDSIRESNEDKKYYLQKTEEYNAIGDALSDYMHRLSLSAEKLDDHVKISGAIGLDHPTKTAKLGSELRDDKPHL